MKYTIDVKKAPKEIVPNNMYTTELYPESGNYSTKDMGGVDMIMFVNKEANMIWGVAQKDITLHKVKESAVKVTKDVPAVVKSVNGVSEELFLKAIAILHGKVKEVEL